MTRKRPSNVELLRKLTAYNKPYFTVTDLEKVLGLPRPSVRVTLNRLVQAGVLTRLRRNIYIAAIQGLEIEKVVSEVYYPCYLSFASALAEYGILSQLPHTVTFATTRLSQTVTLGDTIVELIRLPAALFFGYTLNDGKAIARPEKALLDQLYLVSKHAGYLSLPELDLKDINQKLLLSYAKQFPKNVQTLAEQLKLQRKIY